ncbi:MAG: sulfur carrier protein ThiS [Bacteroidia bacterium]|nr:sulfur carrier protein ThiS [Bacteroidia bacterium]MDW8235488.1 sulfur carrier protein ThiS [Bacteroidia bacterium]
MQVKLNGEPISLPEGITVIQLLERLQIDAHKVGVAVAVNRHVIPRREWQQVRLQPGDQIELVYARQGG